MYKVEKYLNIKPDLFLFSCFFCHLHITIPRLFCLSSNMSYKSIFFDLLFRVVDDIYLVLGALGLLAEVSKNVYKLKNSFQPSDKRGLE